MTILIHFTDSDNILEIDSSSSSTDIKEARNVINQEFDKIANIRASSPTANATPNICNALSLKFANTSGKMNWRLRSQIKACLSVNAQSGKLTQAQAHDLFSKKKLPAKYSRQIAKYLRDNS